jgi:hypothetical protein
MPKSIKIEISLEEYELNEDWTIDAVIEDIVESHIFENDGKITGTKWNIGTWKLKVK